MVMQYIANPNALNFLSLNSGENSRFYKTNDTILTYPAGRDATW